MLPYLRTSHAPTRALSGGLLVHPPAVYTWLHLAGRLTLVKNNHIWVKVAYPSHANAVQQAMRTFESLRGGLEHRLHTTVVRPFDMRCRHSTSVSIGLSKSIQGKWMSKVMYWFPDFKSPDFKIQVLTVFSLIQPAPLNDPPCTTGWTAVNNRDTHIPSQQRH